MTTGIFYKVTSARGVNLRDSPNRNGKRILALPPRAIVTRIGDTALAGDWYMISWNGHEGFAASAYLTPVNGSPADLATSAAAGETVLPPASPIGVADRDPMRLHPIVRQAVLATLADLQDMGINFRIHEAFRSPERQAYLYASGRTRPGARVTNAQPWRSMHQYGLAADLVLFTDEGWSWDTSGANGAKWTAMHKAAKARGLKPLSFELPHVEPADGSWQQYLAGDLPPGGDESWYESVGIAAERWRLSGRAPSGPMVAIGQRPALRDV